MTMIAPSGQDKPEVELNDEELAQMLDSPVAKMQPLIYTSKGNLPICILQHRYGWLVTEDQTTFIEQYLLRGEIVKQSVHVYRTNQGVELQGVAMALAGGAPAPAPEQTEETLALEPEKLPIPEMNG